MQTIVVGIDGTEIQERVLAAAEELATTRNASLVVVRAVILPVDLPPLKLGVRPEDVGSILIDSARRDAERATAALKDRIAELRVVLETPWRALCEAAKEKNASLLIIGAHAYGALDRLLGTTAAKVVNHAACSVLVVR